MKTITRVYRVYDDCNDCTSFLKPDAEGKINLVTPAGSPCVMTIHKTIITPDGEKPNPCKGYCDARNRDIVDTKMPLISHTTGEKIKCFVEHFISENTIKS